MSDGAVSCVFDLSSNIHQTGKGVIGISDYYFRYNGTSSTELGIHILRRPDMPVPRPQIQEIQVEGRDGKLYRDKGTFEDVVFTIECNFLSTPEFFAQKLREVKRWMYGLGSGELQLHDDFECFYAVKKAEIGNAERVLKQLGRFSLRFTCDPYSYLVEGTKERTLPTTLYNAYELSKPIYKLAGDGIAELRVNGNGITVEVQGEITIDTQRQLCYSGKQEIRNRYMAGDYAHLFLRPGDNTFSVSSGFTASIIPNWRTL